MAKETSKVYVDLSNTLTMEELLTGAVKSSNFAEDTIISGKIVEKRQDSVLVDIGYKAEGMLASTEFKCWEDVKVGDSVDVYLESIENSLFPRQTSSKPGTRSLPNTAKAASSRVS